MIKPITPQELDNGAAVPECVITIVNKLISDNYQNGRATVFQDDVVDALVSLGKKKTAVFAGPYLNFESLYQVNGWEVDYEKPGYNETGRAYWTFVKKK